MTEKTYHRSNAMHNPPHPGEVLKDIIIAELGLTVKSAAQHLGVERVTLSRVLNAHASVSTEMALRLAKALNTSPAVWLRMQQTRDVWEMEQSSKIDLSRIKPFAHEVQDTWH